MRNVFLNLLFPRACAACRAELRDADACDACLQSVPVFKWVFCIVCGRRLPDFSQCRLHSQITPLAGTGIASDYRHPVTRILIHTYKYRGRRALADPLATLLIRHAEEGFAKHLAASECLVAPIPLTKRREYKRGFNQAALIAERFARHFGLGYEPNILMRHIERAPQVKMKDRKSRLKNIKGVFRAAGESSRASGRTILLIDDVASSGATLEEAGRVLKAAGAKTIWAMVIARGS